MEQRCHDNEVDDGTVPLANLHKRASATDTYVAGHPACPVILNRCTARNKGGK